jgi:hypothetical protein
LRRLLLVVMTACGRMGFDTYATSDIDATLIDSPPPQGDGMAGPPQLVNVGAVIDVNSNINITLTLPAPSTAGTLLVATMATSKSFGPQAPWVAASSGTAVTCYSFVVEYPDNPGGIASVTFTLPGTSNSVGQLSEWSGVATTPLDQTAGGTVSPKATSQTLSASSSMSAELGISAFCQYATTPAYSPSAGWTQLGMYSGATSGEISYVANYQLGLAMGPVGATETSTVSADWAGELVTFHP